jgi:hypothetical protein
MEIVSVYGDAWKANRLLSNNLHLEKFAREFCHEFNTRVSFDGDNFHNRGITLEMPNGMRIGELSVNTSNGKPVYVADMPSIISKDRSSKWSGNGARDSEKLPNLIRTIKKNKEQPTDAKVLEMFNSAIYHALAEITNSREPNFGINGTQALDALKAVLGIDNMSVHQHIPEFQKMYDNYMKAVASVKDSQATADRFKKGCTMIYIENERYKADSVSGYYVADFVTAMNPSTGKLGYEFQSPLKRYASLKETEHAPTVAMIRSYMESQTRYFDKDNELGIKYTDHFFEDMDIAVGHSNNKLVVLLPKHAP